MQSRAIRKILPNGFLLSLILHLLLLISVLMLMNKPKEKKEQELLPHDYVPAYTYSGSIQPSAPSQPAQNSSAQESSPTSSKTKVAEQIDRTENTEEIQSVEHTLSQLSVPKIQKKMPAKKMRDISMQPKSLLASSLNMLRDEQMQDVTRKKEAEPIYMIGDDSQPADPLIKLLGRSLSAHFRYPRMAGQFGIHGRVIVGLTLNPDGHYSDVEMMQSSDNQDLDAAALYAVNSAPRVDGADRFISKPKHFVIGFIFN